MPISYAWTIAPSTGSGVVPDPGNYVPSTPLYGADARKNQFERGIKFANIPLGRADFVQHGGPRVRHINSVLNVQQKPSSDELNRAGLYSGAVKFRFRSYRSIPVPLSISVVEKRSSDIYGNPKFSFTGKYPDGFSLYTIGQGYTTALFPFSGSAFYASTKLNDGRVFVYGGLTTGSVVMSSSFIYSPTSGTWVTGTTQGTKLVGASAITLNDGRVLLVGGTTGSNLLANAQSQSGSIWDPVSGSWTAVTGSFKSKHNFFEMVKLSSGKIFIPGGSGSLTVGSDIFDPSTNTVSGALPFPAAPFSREGFTATRLDDDSVLVAGGWDASGLVPTNQVFRFYPSTLSWSIEPSMSVARSFHKALKSGSKVYFIGGFIDVSNATDSVECYNSEYRVMLSASSMFQKRAGFAATAYSTQNYPNDRFIVMGGKDGSNMSGTIEEYVPDFDSWTKVASLKVPTAFNSAIQITPSSSFDAYSFIIPGGMIATSAVALSGTQFFSTSS